MGVVKPNSKRSRSLCSNDRTPPKQFCWCEAASIHSPRTILSHPSSVGLLQSRTGILPKSCSQISPCPSFVRSAARCRSRSRPNTVSRTPPRSCAPFWRPSTDERRRHALEVRGDRPYGDGRCAHPGATPVSASLPFTTARAVVAWTAPEFWWRSAAPGVSILPSHPVTVAVLHSHFPQLEEP